MASAPTATALQGRKGSRHGSKPHPGEAGWEGQERGELLGGKKNTQTSGVSFLLNKQFWASQQPQDPWTSNALDTDGTAHPAQQRRSPVPSAVLHRCCGQHAHQRCKQHPSSPPTRFAWPRPPLAGLHWHHRSAATLALRLLSRQGHCHRDGACTCMAVRQAAPPAGCLALQCRQAEQRGEVSIILSPAMAEPTCHHGHPAVRTPKLPPSRKAGQGRGSGLPGFKQSLPAGPQQLPPHLHGVVIGSSGGGGQAYQLHRHHLVEAPACEGSLATF